jgi:hypothetical protein
MGEENIVTCPCCNFTFLHAGKHFQHGGMLNTSMREGQNVPAPTGFFPIRRTAIFQRRASF